MTLTNQISRGPALPAALFAGCLALLPTGCTDEPGTSTETASSTGAATGSSTGPGGTDSTAEPDTGSSSTGGETGTDPTTGGESTVAASTSTGELEATTTSGDTSTSDTSSTTGTSSTGDSNTGTTADTEDTGEPVKPDDCVDLPLAGIELVSQQQHQFDSSGTVPLVRSPQSQLDISGDPALFDLLRILFDGDIAVGTHALDPDPNHAIPAFVKTFVTVSDAAVVYQEDLQENVYARRFIAVAGELEIVDMITPHQTQGSVKNVELREFVLNPDSEELELLVGGLCYWIDEAPYDVRRARGCEPFAPDACPDGEYCMPVNAVGSDGECVDTATKLAGETCERESPTAWDSDCAPGLRCIDINGGLECTQVCDILSDAPGCPSGTHCGGGYNLCLDEALLQQSGIDPAPLGEPCVDDPNAGYCGGAGRPGLCYDDDAGGPLTSTCRPFAAAPSQCEAPQTAGYVAYKAGIDRSTLWCLTP